MAISKIPTRSHMVGENGKSLPQGSCPVWRMHSQRQIRRWKLSNSMIQDQVELLRWILSNPCKNIKGNYIHGRLGQEKLHSKFEKEIQSCLHLEEKEKGKARHKQWFSQSLILTRLMMRWLFHHQEMLWSLVLWLTNLYGRRGLWASMYGSYGEV